MPLYYSFLDNNRADSQQHSLHTRIESVGIAEHLPGTEQSGNAVSMYLYFYFHCH